MLSVWSDQSTLPTFEALTKDKNTEVLIIGGGITGLLCSHFLKQAGIDHILVEATRICSGITPNTTAKITSQHGLIYHKIVKKYDENKAGLYLQANEDAISSYCSLCSSIDCEFESKDSYVYSRYDSSKILQEVFTVNKLGAPAEYVDELDLPFSIAGAVKFENQAQFNPLQFLAKLSEGLPIYEHTMVHNIKNNTAFTNHGRIHAKKIIVATHFPFLNRHGSYFLKMYQHRSYVLALENAANVNGMYVDELDTGLSFRNYKNLLLLGGGSHRTGKQGGNWEELQEVADKYYPHAAIRYRWATQDCMTLDDIPYIGQYSLNTPNLFVATGFCKWGMTSSMVAAGLLRDLVLEKENPYEMLFSPSRTMLHPQLAENALEATANLLTPSLRRCPHMGCTLKWNPQEQTWDCPCHGSRFAEDGGLINGPAKRGLRYHPGTVLPE